jgi:hypothetical protein
MGFHKHHPDSSRAPLHISATAPVSVLSISNDMIRYRKCGRDDFQRFLVEFSWICVWIFAGCLRSEPRAIDLLLNGVPKERSQ